MEERARRVVIGGVVAALALSGCQLKDAGDELVNGKTLFVAECAACHVLERAGATGVDRPRPRRRVPAVARRRPGGEHVRGRRRAADPAPQP